MEGSREITRTIKEYNLDVLIAVGYRINSVIGTKFRQWATRTLKEHVVRGYTVNRKRIAKNYEAFMKSVADVQGKFKNEGYGLIFNTYSNER